MPNFMLAYHGGTQPENPGEGKKQMERWKSWLADLGAAVVNPGTPLGNSKTVSTDGVNDGGGANPMSGFSVLSADTMDAALEMAKNCPFIEMDTATIVVSEMKEMGM